METWNTIYSFYSGLIPLSSPILVQNGRFCRLKPPKHPLTLFKHNLKAFGGINNNRVNDSNHLNTCGPSSGAIDLDLGPEIDQKSTIFAKMGGLRSIIWIRIDFSRTKGRRIYL